MITEEAKSIFIVKCNDLNKVSTDKLHVAEDLKNSMELEDFRRSSSFFKDFPSYISICHWHIEEVRFMENV